MSIEECYIFTGQRHTVPGCRVSIKARRPISQATLSVL